MSQAQVLIRNVISGFATQFWVLVLGFIATPYIIKAMGTDSFGVLTLCSTIVGYFAFLELGLGLPIVKYLAEHVAKGENDDTCRLVGTANGSYLAIGAIGGLLLASLTPTLVSRFLRLPPDLTGVALFSLYLTAAGFPLTMIATVLGFIPRALQRFDISNKITAIMTTLQIFITVVLLYLGFTLKEILVAYLVLGVASVLVYFSIDKKLLPGISLRPRIHKTTFLKLLRYSTYVLIIQLSWPIIAQIDRILIGLFLPIAHLSYYVIPCSIAQKLYLIQANIASVAFPAVSEMSALKMDQRIRSLYIRASKMIFLGTLPVAIFLMVYGGELLRFWISQDFAAAGKNPLQILAFSFLLSAIMGLPATILQGIGKPQIVAAVSAASAVAHLLLGIILIPRAGILGGALIWLFSQMIIVPVYFLTCNREIGASSALILKNCYFRPLLLGFAQALLFLATGPLAVNLASVLFIGGAGYALYLLVGYFYALEPAERKFLEEYFSSFSRRQ